MPLKGEVARLEADKDSVLVVNKLNNTYVRESLEQASKLADITLSDLQDVFIGRVFHSRERYFDEEKTAKGQTSMPTAMASLWCRQGSRKIRCFGMVSMHTGTDVSLC